MSDFFDTPVGSMNFRPPPHPKDGRIPTGTPPISAPANVAHPKDGPAGATPVGTPPPSGTTPAPPPATGTPPPEDPYGGAPANNPLVLMLQGRPRFGTFGQINGLTQNPAAYHGEVTPGSEGGGGSVQQVLNDNIVQGLHGMVQVNNMGVGQPGGVFDPSKVTYDPTYGLITDPSNIVPGYHETFMDQYGPWLMVAAAGAGAIAEGAGLIGGGIDGAAGAAGADGAIAGGETIPEVVGPGGAMLPPGVAGGVDGTAGAVIPPPVDAAPAGADIVGPPAELAPPPPSADLVGPPADLAPPPYVAPADIADGLTTPINDLVTPPLPSGSDITMPPLDAPPSTPDFNIQMQPPPDVNVPLPDIQQPWWSAPLDAVTDHPLQAAGLGMNAFNMLNRPKAPGINSNIPDTNKPVIDGAIQDILHKGQLSPDQQHSIDGIIDRHIREGVEALNQRAINSGMGANSMVTQQQINQFKQNAETVRAQLYQQQMQQNIGNAIAIWSEGNREDIAIQTAAANLAAENNREIAALNQSIAQSLGWLAAMSNSRSAPTPPPGG